MFFGEHISKLDAKGRVSIPAPHRAALDAEVEGARELVVYPSMRVSGVLEGVSRATLNDWAARIRDGFQTGSQQQLAMSAAIMGRSIELKRDDTGRVVMRKDMITSLGLAKEVSFMGMGDRMFIGHPDLVRRFVDDCVGFAQQEQLVVPDPVRPNRSVTPGQPNYESPFASRAAGSGIAGEEGM
ncbi:MAG: hypothetical protein Alpg2KO_23630 [Alphaproteobacteria bacterium]